MGTLDSLIPTAYSKYHLWILLICCYRKSKTGFSKLESPSCFCILILKGAQNFKFPDFWYATLIGWILKVQVIQDKVSLEIKKIKIKRESSIDLDVHHSKVPSSECIFNIIKLLYK